MQQQCLTHAMLLVCFHAKNAFFLKSQSSETLDEIYNKLSTKFPTVHFTNKIIVNDEKIYK